MFNLEKTTQLVALFLWKSGGNFTMSCLNLMLMLYFTEKEGLLRYGYSITGDEILSMPNGPVLSNTYNLITDGSDNIVWNDWMCGKKDYCVALLPKGITFYNYEDKFDLLSKAEVMLVDEIFNKYNRLTKSQICNILHENRLCPEWNKSQYSLQKITIEDLFLSNHRTKEEADFVKKKIAENASYSQLCTSLI